MQILDGFGTSRSKTLWWLRNDPLLCTRARDFTRPGFQTTVTSNSLFFFGGGGGFFYTQLLLPLSSDFVMNALWLDRQLWFSLLVTCPYSFLRFSPCCDTCLLNSALDEQANYCSSNSLIFFELLSRSAGDNGWKHDVYTENILSMSPKCLMRNQQKEVSSLISRHTPRIFVRKQTKNLWKKRLN